MSLRKSLNLKLVLVLSFAFSIGCSNQWREADLQMDSKAVLAVLSQIESEISGQGSSPQTAQNFFSIMNNPASSIYFADATAAGGPLGPIVSVFSVVNYAFAGPGLVGLSYLDLSEIKVAFVYLPAESASQCALMVDSVTLAGSVETSFYNCTSLEISGGEFYAHLERADGYQIALRSYDVYKNGDFKGVIQLKVYDIDAAGNELSNGKLSTLVGFGP